jgi:hypothetical protein
MSECLSVVLVGLIIALYAIFDRRAKKLEKRLSDLELGMKFSDVPELRKRITALERVMILDRDKPVGEPAAAVEEAPEPEPEPEPAPLPARAPAVPKPPPPAVKPAQPPAVPRERTAPPRSEPAAPAAQYRPTLVEKLIDSMKGEEWEAVIGGSWFNKAGVLVLIIALVLILNYSLTHLGPTGKIIVGLAVSLVMLAGGVLLERRPQYRIFARGLIGGGWAGLYFTTFAMHGIDASRIIDNPLVATLLLLAVAVAMIVHSLKYRSQAVTGLAYFTGFLALAISPAGTFAAVATALLAGSLLCISFRLSWNSVAVIGVVATYGIYLLHHPAAAQGSALITSQAVLLIYWALFETYDLINIVRRPDDGGIARSIFPLNTAGFVGVSLLQWSEADIDNLYIFFGLAAAAYLLSTLLRARLRPVSSFPDETDPLRRALFGGYEAAVTVAVVLATLGLLLKFSGARLTIALLLEAELLFFSGLSLRQPYLRMLGGAIFLMPVLKLIALDIARYRQAPDVLLGIGKASLLALLITAVGYVNRACSRHGRAAWMRRPEQAYSYIASALVTIALLLELDPGYLGLGWLILSTLLMAFALWSRLLEFRIQSYIASGLALTTLLVVNLAPFGAVSLPSPWLTLGLSALLAYGGTAFLLRPLPDRIPEAERRACRTASSVAGTILAAGLLWHVLDSPLVAVGWAALGLLLIECGLRLPLKTLRLQGNVVMLAVFGRLFLANFTISGATAGISHRLLTVLPLIALYYYLSNRMAGEVGTSKLAALERGLSRLYLYLPAILAAVLMRFELGRVAAVIGWALLTVVLLVLGRLRNNRDLLWQSYMLALACFFRSWVTNFNIPESLAGVSARIATGAIVIASFFAAQFISPRRPVVEGGGGNPLRRLFALAERYARPGFAVLGSLLLTLLLFYEVSGSLLTVALGLQGVALMLIGFPVRERAMRLYGLILFMFCILKAFLFDMRALETPYRILSFMTLGLFLIGVSWLYTRYSEKIKRFL